MNALDVSALPILHAVVTVTAVTTDAMTAEMTETDETVMTVVVIDNVCIGAALAAPI